MFDTIELLYTCEITSWCHICKYYELCKLYLEDYINIFELQEFATIHYAEGEI